MSLPECPNGCDLRGEPIAEAHRHFFAPDTTHYSRLIGHEIQGVYDGVLFWSCPDCGIAWPRWTEGTRGEEARRYSDAVNAQRDKEMQQ